MQIFPFPLSFQFHYLLYFPTNESLIRCVWILLLLRSTVTSKDIVCKGSVRKVELKVEFFSRYAFFPNVYPRSLRVISYNKIVQKWKMFFIPTDLHQPLQKCDFENEYIERAENVSAIVSIRRGQGSGKAFVTGSQLLPIIFLPTFACYWSSSLGKRCCYDPAIHFEFWGRPFSLVVWKVTRLFGPPPPPQTGGNPVGG